jgi:hypothetical protein
MRKINAYILEKLHLNKDTKLNVKNFKIEDKDMEYPLSIFKLRNFNTNGLNPVIVKARPLMEYISFMLITHSKPFIFKDKIYSIPGNYCKDLVDKALEKDKNLTLQDVIFAYDMNKDDYSKDIPKKLKDEYLDRIGTIIKRALGESAKYNINLLTDDYENYSERGIELLHDRTSKVVLPFELEYSGKKVKCELAYSGKYTFFHYRVNGKNYRILDEFVEVLLKEFNII